VPEYFIGHLVDIFREVYRVMRDDSVTWIVIADSFWDDNKRRHISKVRDPLPGEENGQLIGIPNMLFLALKADGWIVRNDPPWAKTNPMPESVSGQRWERCRVKVGRRKATQYKPVGWDTREQSHNALIGRYEDRQHEAVWQPCPGCPKCEDHGGYVLRRGSWRHTRAHETVLMCVKSMGYWSDQEAVREAVAGWRANKAGRQAVEIAPPGCKNPGAYTSSAAIDRQPKDGRRNPRSVLTPKPESYSGKHYACFPTSLIAPLIRATCPSRCCPVCGAGWSPVVERELSTHPPQPQSHLPDSGKRESGKRGNLLANIGQYCSDSNVLGYRPTCDCQPTLKTGETELPDAPDADSGIWVPAPIPGIVFDPFLGSGTTLQVARELMLNGVGLDLAHTYLDEQAKVRARVGTPSNALDGLPLFDNI
jgi:DNA modification methylase